MSGPMVSIIIPAYNYGRFIKGALQSAFAQTYGDCEVIVVDDGSTDDTEQCVETFAPNVRYIYQPNAGPASARNTGIRASRGAYLAFLDADDVWLPRRLERQVELMDRHPEAGAVYTWWAFMDESGNPLPQVATPTQAGDVRGEMLFGSFVTLPMCLVRRTCFDRVGLLDPTLKLAEDWDILLRIANAGFTFACVPEILMRNRLHPGSHSCDTSRKFDHDCQVLDKALSALPPGPQRDAIRRSAYRALVVSTAMDLFMQDQWEAGSKLFAEGVELDPALLDRPGSYLGLAFSLIPYGYRTWEELGARADATAAMLMKIIRGLFRSPHIADQVACRKRVAWSSLLLALAVIYGRSGRRLKTIGLLGKAFMIHPFTLGIAVLSRIRRLIGKASQDFTTITPVG